MMKEKKFKTFLYPNKISEIKDGKLMVRDGDKLIEVKQDEYYVSPKKDGVRILIIPSLGLVTRSLKPVQNQNIHKKLQPLIDWCDENNIMLDGEVYDNQISFQDIISIVMTMGDEKIVPDNFKYHIFDALKTESVRKEDKITFISADWDEEFSSRMNLIPNNFSDISVIVEQKLVNSENYNVLTDMFREALADDEEGLILRNKLSPYKTNRATIKESFGFKFKEMLTSDMRILEVIQATEVSKTAEKTINELGGSVTSKKKDDRVLIEKASAFKVSWNGNEFKASIAESDEEKKKIWQEREKYIDEFCEVKYMMTGSKDGVPRHPVVLRMRFRRDDE